MLIHTGIAFVLSLLSLKTIMYRPSAFFFSLQHNQWVRITIERRAQDIPAESSVAFTQSQVSKCISPTGNYRLSILNIMSCLAVSFK